MSEPTPKTELEKIWENQSIKERFSELANNLEDEEPEENVVPS